jgi:hypothetical protein
MGKFLRTQNSFAQGEISPEFFARNETMAAAGLSKLENMDVLPSGALTRRRGTLRIAEADADAMLIPFIYRDQESYLLALSPGHIRIFRNDALMQDLLSPFSDAEIKSVQYAQRFGTMIFTHEKHPPVILQRIGGLFELKAFNFSMNSDQTQNIPFMRFDDAAGIALTVAANFQGNNFATLTTAESFWHENQVGTRLSFLDRQWVICEFINAKTIVARTNAAYTPPGGAVTLWKEAAFSTRRGWPRSITFHQDRLVFGGSRDWPCGVWMSKVGDHTNFDAGTGLDDEAIFITLLSDRQQQISTVVSSTNLQILTTAGEWAITAKPLTPSTIDIRQHTSVGSPASVYFPPQQVEGRTVFVANNTREIRELALDDLSENYSAIDLCVPASHLMKQPAGIVYADERNQILIPMRNGVLAVLAKNSALGIAAWGTYKTQGEFKSVTVLGDEIYIVVKRDPGTFIEKFSDAATTDSGEFSFRHAACALPVLAEGHSPKRLRVHKLSARVLNTKSLFFKDGGKEHRAPIPTEAQGDSSSGYSGDTGINLLGSTPEIFSPLWEIVGNEPLPCTILSVTAEGRFSV